MMKRRAYASTARPGTKVRETRASDGVRIILGPGCDLSQAHEATMRKLENTSTLPSLREQETKLKQRLAKPLRINERRALNEDLTKVLKTIADIESCRLINEYKRDALPILAKIRSSGMVGSSSSFFSRGVTNFNPDQIGLILNYVDVIKRYINVRVDHPVKAIDSCLNCARNMTDTIADDDGTIHCESCGCIWPFVHPHHTSERGSTSGYDSKENFKKAWLCYLGDETTPLPPDIYRKLDEHFVSKGLPSSAEVKLMPLNSRGKRGSTDVMMILSGLAALQGSYTDYYKNSVRIGQRMYGWARPDIDHLRDLIMDDYDMTESIRVTLPDAQGHSSISANWRLCQHLRLRGHDCGAGELKLIETEESLAYNRRIWEQICIKASETDPNFYYIADDVD